MNENDTIEHDERPIAGIYFNDKDETHWEAKSGYTIEAYGEPGMACYIPYFRVIKNGEVVSRIPAWQVTVVYVHD